MNIFEKPTIPPSPEQQERPPHFPTEVIEMFGAKQEQQDANGFREFVKDGEPTFAAVVADGHGEKGDQAAQRAVQVLMHHIEDKDVDADWLKRRFVRTHHAITKEVPGNNGTTCTFAYLRKNHLTLAWVGDSEARVFRHTGQLEPLTVPHNIGTHAGETKRLEQQGTKITHIPNKAGTELVPYVMVGEYGLQVTRSLGDANMNPHVSYSPEILEDDIGPLDRYLLVGSDGIWKKMERSGRKEELEKVLTNAATLQEAREAIAHLLRSWGQGDNVTLVITELPIQEPRT